MAPVPTHERRYRGRTAAERRADRRRRLLDTALELYGTLGYTTVGIERLCGEAGVTARHFYEEFGSREGLLTALFDEICQDAMVDVNRALAEQPPDPPAVARAGIGAFIHSLLGDPRRARVACIEVVGVSPELERHRRAFLHRTAALVSAEGRQLGAVDRERELGVGFSLQALALVAGTNELMIEWIVEPDHPSIAQVVDSLVSMYLAVGFPQGRARTS